MHLSSLAAPPSFPQIDVERKTARLAINGHFLAENNCGKETKKIGYSYRHVCLA
jgi:hypothetical protein